MKQCNISTYISISTKAYFKMRNVQLLINKKKKCIYCTVVLFFKLTTPGVLRYMYICGREVHARIFSLGLFVGYRNCLSTLWGDEWTFGGTFLPNGLYGSSFRLIGHRTLHTTWASFAPLCLIYLNTWG